jgi:hypothetical protein
LNIFVVILTLASALYSAVGAVAQGKKIIKENLKVEFPTMLKATKKALSDMGCRIEVEKTEQGSDNLYKSNIRTEFYIFATGLDTTKDVAERYSCEGDSCENFPFIRGGEFVSARIQYKMFLREKEDNSVDFRLEGELSGYEQWVTHKVHFWDSNGILETEFFNRVKANLGLPAPQEAPPPAPEGGGN